MDADGTKNGYDIPLTKAISSVVNVPVIASGGAGTQQHFVDLFQSIPNIDAGLAASVFHFGEIAIPNLKKTLRNYGVNVRL